MRHGEPLESSAAGLQRDLQRNQASVLITSSDSLLLLIRASSGIWKPAVEKSVSKDHDCCTSLPPSTVYNRVSSQTCPITGPPSRSCHVRSTPTGSEDTVESETIDSSVGQHRHSTWNPKIRTTRGRGYLGNAVWRLLRSPPSWTGWGHTGIG